MELGLLLDAGSGIRWTFALTQNGCISRDFLIYEETDLEWVVVLVGSKLKARLVSLCIACSTNEIPSSLFFFSFLSLSFFKIVFNILFSGISGLSLGALES